MKVADPCSRVVFVPGLSCVLRWNVFTLQGKYLYLSVPVHCKNGDDAPVLLGMFVYTDIEAQTLAYCRELIRTSGQRPAIPLRTAIDEQAMVAALQNVTNVDVKCTNATGGNLAHEAAILGFPALMARAIALGFDLNKQNRQGCTPLHYAIFNGLSREVVRLLVETGAHPHVADNNGNTPFGIAQAFEDQETVQLLQNVVQRF